MILKREHCAPTCGRASRCQVAVVHDLASGFSLRNPDQMVPSAPDHKNASLLPPEPNRRVKVDTRRSTKHFASASVSTGRPRSVRCPRLCHVLLLPPLQQPRPGHAAAQRQEARFWSVAFTSQVRVHEAESEEHVLECMWLQSLAHFASRGAFERLLCSFCAVVCLWSN